MNPLPRRAFLASMLAAPFIPKLALPGRNTLTLDGHTFSVGDEVTISTVDGMVQLGGEVYWLSKSGGKYYIMKMKAEESENA
jgi:hypothetical protein